MQFSSLVYSLHHFDLHPIRAVHHDCQAYESIALLKVDVRARGRPPEVHREAHICYKHVAGIHHRKGGRLVGNRHGQPRLGGGEDGACEAVTKHKALREYQGVVQLQDDRLGGRVALAAGDVRDFADTDRVRVLGTAPLAGPLWSGRMREKQA